MPTFRLPALRTGTLLVVLSSSILVFQNCAPGFSPYGFDELASSTIANGLTERLTCTEASRGLGDTTSRRLTKLELKGTLESVFGSKLVSDTRVVTALENITAETSKTFGKNFSPQLTAAYMDGILAIAEAVSVVATEDRSILSSAISGCDPDRNINGCVETLSSSFALKVLRRPLTDPTKSELQTLLNSASGLEKLQLGIARLMLSPNFYQHVETGDTVVGARLKLTPYEVASRLSYRLTGAAPDEELLKAAASNSLATRAQLIVHARRLLATTQARRHVREFFTTWLGLERTPDPDSGIAKLRGFQGVGLGAEAREEMLRYMDYIVFEKRGGFHELFTSAVVFPYTDRLANLYGVQKSDGPVSVSDGRGGMILRLAPLMNNSLNSNPIVRGGHLRTHLLCQDIPPPDPTVVANRLSETEILSHLNLSNRAIVHQTTAVPQCIGCHNMINPLGFALEGFDGFGLPRTKEKVYDESVKVVAEHAIDTYVLDLNIASVPRPVADAAGLVREIANSDRARLCLGRKIIEYTRARAPAAADGCVVNEGAETMQEGSSILDFFVVSATAEDIFWKSAK